MARRKNIFVPGKRDYIQGKKRPKVDCILCSILNKDPKVENLLIWRDGTFAVSANLYPYNAGHLLIFPLRHILDYRDLSLDEAESLFLLNKRCLSILEEIYEPDGFNMGWNLGEASGASIDHLHQHLVPRYPKELGFIDICAGEKIIIEDPAITLEKLKEAFHRGEKP